MKRETKDAVIVMAIMAAPIAAYLAYGYWKLKQPWPWDNKTTVTSINRKG